MPRDLTTLSPRRRLLTILAILAALVIPFTVWLAFYEPTTWATPERCAHGEKRVRTADGAECQPLTKAPRRRPSSVWE